MPSSGIQFRTAREGSQTRNMRIICICAVKLELAWLLEHLARPERLKLKGVKAWSGRIEGCEALLACIGIGPIAARENLERLLASGGFDRAYHFGLCGALAAGFDLCRPVVARSVVAAWDPSHEPLIPDMPSLEALEALSVRPLEGSFVTNGMPVFNNQLKSFLAARFKADCVDMESWEVARVCAARGIPLTIVKSVSDLADSTMYESFHGHARPAALTAQQTVLELLHHGQA
jgi:adenosylhomocysteine nucleosidase